MLINYVEYVNLFMQSVKMYPLKGNLGQLCNRNREHYCGLPCLQIQLACTIHAEEISLNENKTLIKVLYYFHL